MRKEFTAACVAVGIVTSMAVGGSILPPGFDITCQVNDGPLWHATNNQGDFTVDPNTGAISGESQGAAWAAQWDSINFHDNSGAALSNYASLTTAWAFTNTTGSTQLFTVTFTSPVAVAISGPTNMFGSITGGLTANSQGQAAQIWAPTGGSIYTAMISGNPVSPTLMNDPFHKFTNPPTDTAPLGFENFEWVPGPGVSNNISIQFMFELTAGDSVTFNAAFTVVPAPAGVALLAMFGLGATRRRRD